MKNFTTAAIIGASLTFGVAGLSNATAADHTQKFKSTINAPVSAVRINVILSEDLLYRADNLATNHQTPYEQHRIYHLEHSGPHQEKRGIDDGFKGHGLYGEKDLGKLSENLKSKMKKQLNKQNIVVSDDAKAVIHVLIKDVHPNHPTQHQRSQDRSISKKNYGIGGAEFRAVLVINGEISGTMSYAWYETSLIDARYESTWGDTHQAMKKFAKKTAKSFKN